MPHEEETSAQYPAWHGPMTTDGALHLALGYAWARCESSKREHKPMAFATAYAAAWQHCQSSMSGQELPPVADAWSQWVRTRGASVGVPS